MCLQRVFQLVRRTEIVFDGITVSHDLRVFQSRNQFEHLILHVTGKTGRDPVDVNLMRAAPLRLEEQLMPILVRELDHFVFDRWTVTRSAAVDLPAVHRCPMKVGLDQFMHIRIGISNPARQLLQLQLVRHKRKRLGVVIARLDFGFAVVDRATIKTRRSTSFEALQAEAKSV